MGYPYGDMAYPTIEEMESNYARSSFETAFHFELSRLMEEWRDEAAKHPLHDDEDGYYCEEEPPEAKYRDMWGLAFARALAWSADYDSDSLNRFVTDFEALMEDKALTKFEHGRNHNIDVKDTARSYAEYAKLADEAASDPDSSAAAMEHHAAKMGLGPHSYADSTKTKAGELEHMLARDLSGIRERYAALIGDKPVSNDDRKHALLVANGILSGELATDDVKPEDNEK